MTDGEIYPVRKYFYGLRFEHPNRTRTFKLWESSTKSPEPKIDLRNEYMPPIFDQGRLGSCTANGLAAAFSYQYNVEFKTQYIPSRLFIYYNERRIEGTVTTDSGAQISDGVKVLETIGTCSESSWPYIVSMFADKPHNWDYKYAKKQRVTKAAQVQPTVDDFRTALTQGHPVVFGFSVPATVENIDSTGFMPPYDTSQQIMGGHCVCCVGYDDNMIRPMIDRTVNNPPGYLIIRNSWGIAYADEGYFYMPYSFFTSGLISDCWVLDIVTD